MEAWQRAHIERNLASLVESTTYTTLLSASLRSKGTICLGDHNILDSKKFEGKDSQTMAMYILLETRENGFESIILALLETSQDLPHQLLLNGYKGDIPRQLSDEIEKVKNSTRTQQGSSAPPEVDSVPREITNFRKQIKNDNGNKTFWGNWIGEPLSRTAVGSLFNTHIGRNTTHVRNDSSQTIHVALTSEQDSISGITWSGRNGFTFRFKDNNNGRQPQTKTIPPGCKVAFERRNRVDFLNIALENNGQPKITETVGILANQSYAVNKRGCSEILAYDAV